MKNFVIGVLVGLILGGGIAWAYSVGVTLQDSTGNVTGTSSNPIYIQGV